MKHKTDWWLVAIAVVAAVVCWTMLSGCSSCPPAEVVKVPVEVEVPVPVPPEPLMVPVAPDYEDCNQDTVTGVLKCAARNVVKLRAYCAELLAEIEAHNAARAEIPNP